MKRYLLLALILCWSFYLRGEEQDRYILYPTQNVWTFLKLDTTTGQIRHVQYGMTDGERFEYVLSETNIAALLGKKQISGRYKLYPTQNRWTFILIDTIDGETFQVQWGDSCGVVPIPLGTVQKNTEDKTSKSEEVVSNGTSVKDTTPLNFFGLF